MCCGHFMGIYWMSIQHKRKMQVRWVGRCQNSLSNHTALSPPCPWKNRQQGLGCRQAAVVGTAAGIPGLGNSKVMWGSCGYGFSLPSCKTASHSFPWSWPIPTLPCFVKASAGFTVLYPLSQQLNRTQYGLRYGCYCLSQHRCAGRTILSPGKEEVNTVHLCAASQEDCNHTFLFLVLLHKNNCSL